MDRKNIPYVVWAVMFALNNLAVFTLKHLGVPLTPLLNGLLTFLYFLPLVMALSTAVRDTRIIRANRVILTVVLVFICFCWVCSLVLIILG